MHKGDLFQMGACVPGDPVYEVMSEPIYNKLDNETGTPIYSVLVRKIEKTD